MVGQPINQFQYYKNDVKNTKPLGLISIDRFLSAVRNPTISSATLYAKIRKASEDGNEELKQQLKSNLYYFTPAVIVKNGRKYSDIQCWTGLMPLDFDKIDYSEDFRDHLVDEYSFIKAAWLSSSGVGVRALACIPVVKSVKEYKALFYGITEQLGIYNGFDTAPQNCVLPLFMSYDKNLKSNDECDLWDVKGENPKSFDVQTSVYHEVYGTDKDKQTIEKTVITGISKIFDNGHPQLVQVATALGGYVGAGYLTEQEAHELICNVINSNEYLSKKPRVYKRTALEQIRFGSIKPLYL